MSSFNYITKQGERWDSIAYKMYGDVAGTSVLTDANPGVPCYDVLPMGTKLVIPITDDTDSSVITANIPPWKK